MKRLYDGQDTHIDVDDHLHGRDKKTVQAAWCLRHIERFYKGRGRLLEIGSAAGYFLSEARRRGFVVQGLDITGDFCAYAEHVLDVPTHEGTLRDAPFEDMSFDVIYHRNVLSHLAHPRDEFSRMSNLLVSGGFLVFETGNVAELPPERAGELELPDHLHHFSEATIRRLLDQVGLEVIDVARYTLVDRLRPIEWFESWLKARRRQAGGRNVGRAPTVPTELPSSSIKKCVGAMLSQVIRYEVGRVLPSRGLRCTLVIVARRP